MTDTPIKPVLTAQLIETITIAAFVQHYQRTKQPHWEQDPQKHWDANPKAREVWQGVAGTITGALVTFLGSTGQLKAPDAQKLLPGLGGPAAGPVSALPNRGPQPKGKAAAMLDKIAEALAGSDFLKVEQRLATMGATVPTSLRMRPGETKAEHKARIYAYMYGDRD